ncbi:hypothetical protein CROQUDRAFT_353665 [Cronartium quercuum f. sp. fusiforme G11]|uniref:Uncharacterized protein n=1 Tax=Cronartium quercuum f. sp. fusiforme G11 TaxID=708437 RepID=A0A9P6T6G0_9BASI|nr:hypothetical protein CROQUDRAFT_353665 [Cronartium quercuum f. sp. fusiforme G11]
MSPCSSIGRSVPTLFIPYMCFHCSLKPLDKAAAPEKKEPEAVAPAAPEEAEVKVVEKKEKSPKDLAKLARRFSGRLFGTEKKSSKKPETEPTKEEAEETLAVQAEAAAAPAEAEAPAAAEVAPPVEVNLLSLLLPFLLILFLTKRGRLRGGG